jgi:hypothetical protein
MITLPLPPPVKGGEIYEVPSPLVGEGEGEGYVNLSLFCINMLDRRKFLKISGLISLAFSFLPNIFFKNSAFSTTTNSESLKQTKNWLCGSSRKGCSTSRLAMDHHGSLEDGLDDFLNFRFPTEFPNTNVIV